MNGKVIFVGAGPGAPDLITWRGKNALETADVIIYAGSLVNPELLALARPDAVCRNSAGLPLETVIGLIRDAFTAGRTVVRLHTGDPSVYGAIGEQMARLDELGITYEIVPGVSSVFAAAAALQCELTVPGQGQSVILTRQAGRTPVPADESIAQLAANAATVAVFLSVGDIDALVAEFRQAGRP
ncbi:MAG: cobalt-precorrin-4/precorrin-4 C(11)-methyltransferase, partial [Victivallales bacterium]|nr:cobalt-precorrin-4/precorrin-4 C(11)-methyltransferase [Victivallales bacterium]